jgi:hypothetical protein
VFRALVRLTKGSERPHPIEKPNEQIFSKILEYCMIFITSDDPGLECPQEIAEDIRRYVEMTGSPCSCIDQREQAVRLYSNGKRKTLFYRLSEK